MKKGLFITFDGRHGTGKSFIIEKVANEMIKRNYKLFITKEPTDSEIGMLSRRVESKFSSEALVCMFASDRYIHCREIEEKLNKGITVLCDRYIISGMILQNMCGAEFDYIHFVNKYIIKSDISIVLFSDNKVIEKRLALRKKMSSLTKKEMMESRDRYKENFSLLKKKFGNVIGYKNDTIEDATNLVNSLFLEVDAIKKL
jgi:dTMP kinase